MPATQAVEPWQVLTHGFEVPLPDHVCAPKGCLECRNTGFLGRTGVYELLTVDDTIRRHIHEGAAEMTLRSAAAASGMRSLRHDGARWLAQGATSLAELLRVTRA